MKRWTSSWRYVPVDYGYELGCYESTTQTATFRNNLEGTAVRVRLNNRYAEAPMEITHGSLWLRDRESGKLSRELPLTLNGETRLLLPPGEAPYCDPIPCPVSAREDFIVQLYFEKKTPIRCVCVTWAALSWGSTQKTGDFGKTDALGFTVKSKLMPGLSADPYPNQYVAGISDISVETENSPCLIGLFGDSITQMSYFSDSLIQLLYNKYPGQCAVINGGICGNRVQKSHPVIEMMPGKGAQFGISGIDRFRADLCGDGAPDMTFILEGVNDCSHSIVFREPDVPTARDIRDALANVADQAKAAGSRVVCSTIMPFGAWGEPWRDQVEGIRQEVNRLLREETPGDILVDLDAVMRDPDRPDVMQAGMHLGDGVHPGWPGGEKMARAVAEAMAPLLANQ